METRIAPASRGVVRLLVLLALPWMLPPGSGCASAPGAGAAGTEASSEAVIALLGPPDAARILRRLGYRAEVVLDETSLRRHVDTAARGLAFQVRFSGCDRGLDCTSAYLTAGFDLVDGAVTLEQINAWNRERYAQALLDDDGDPWIDFSIQLVGGLTEANFAETIRFYEDQLVAFARFIGFLDEEETTSAAGDDPLR